MLEGERKQVTVLFCDIANSTPLAEKLGAEAMHALLQRFFVLGLEEVHRYEGTVNQFLGDGFMVLFGAPVAHADDARDGLLAVLPSTRIASVAHVELGQSFPRCKPPSTSMHSPVTWAAPSSSHTATSAMSSAVAAFASGTVFS